MLTVSANEAVLAVPNADWSERTSSRAFESTTSVALDLHRLLGVFGEEEGGRSEVGGLRVGFDDGAVIGWLFRVFDVGGDNLDHLHAEDDEVDQLFDDVEAQNDAHQLQDPSGGVDQGDRGGGELKIFHLEIHGQHGG